MNRQPGRVSPRPLPGEVKAKEHATKARRTQQRIAGGQVAAVRAVRSM